MNLSLKHRTLPQRQSLAARSHKLPCRVRSFLVYSSHFHFSLVIIIEISCLEPDRYPSKSVVPSRHRPNYILQAS